MIMDNLHQVPLNDKALGKMQLGDLSNNRQREDFDFEDLLCPDGELN